MLSIVIPVYNEAELIEEVIERVSKVCDSIEDEYELIFIDDGSTDDVCEKILQRRQSNSAIKLIELSRNFGHQAAITAGLEQAKGDYIGLMDCDLQDPPELFVEMYQLLQTEDYDIVNGHRKGRSEKGSRRLLSGIFHRLFSQTSGLKNIEQTGHFSMMNRQALEALNSLKEKNRYLPGLRGFIGFRQTQIEYVRQDRPVGQSKMSTKQLFKLGSDALFSFSRLPLRFCLHLGILGVSVSFLAGLYVLISKSLGWAPIGWSSTTISIYFLGSIQLTFMGVIGEYIFRVYRESQNRPIYFIKKFHN